MRSFVPFSNKFCVRCLAVCCACACTDRLTKLRNRFNIFNSRFPLNTECTCCNADGRERLDRHRRWTRSHSTQQWHCTRAMHQHNVRRVNSKECCSIHSSRAHSVCCFFSTSSIIISLFASFDSTTKMIRNRESAAHCKWRTHTNIIRCKHTTIDEKRNKYTATTKTVDSTTYLVVDVCWTVECAVHTKPMRKTRIGSSIRCGSTNAALLCNREQRSEVNRER